MSRRTVVVALGLAGAALLVGIAVLTARTHGSSRPASTLVARGSVPKHALPPEPLSARCRAINISFRKELRSRGVRFVDLVRAAPTDGDVRGVGSALVLSASVLHPDYGSWGPAVDYLIASARHTVQGTGTQPVLNDGIVASAGRLDADLAAHVCG